MPTRSDASTTETWDVESRMYRRWVYGELVEERPFSDAESAQLDAEIERRAAADLDGARAVQRQTLEGQARTAYLNNRAYLDKVQAGTATNADHIGQVPALTRQMQGLIRIVVGADLLDDIGGQP